MLNTKGFAGQGFDQFDFNSIQPLRPALLMGFAYHHAVAMPACGYCISKVGIYVGATPMHCDAPPAML
jgi:hypothetical protein